MKKLYSSPALCKEVFETADVITVSPMLTFVRIKYSESANLATVDVTAALNGPEGVQ